MSKVALAASIGLLLFFNRDWWLSTAIDQILTRVGLTTI